MNNRIDITINFQTRLGQLKDELVTKIWGLIDEYYVIYFYAYSIWNVKGDDYHKSLLLITVRIDYSPSAALNIPQICFNGITAGNFVLFGWSE